MRLVPSLIPGDMRLLFAGRTILQVTVVVLLALLIVRTIAKRSPPARYSVCICALVCVLFSPVITGLVSAAGWAVIRLPVLPTSASLRAETIPMTSETSLSRPSTSSHPFFPGSSISRSSGAACYNFAFLLFCLWGGGTVFVLTRLLYGRQQLTVLRREITPLATDPVADVLDEVQVTLGVRSLPVMVSKHISVPLVLGFSHPLVVLPEGLAERLDRSQFRDVLIHEGAHIVLRHPRGVVLQRLVTLLFWFHPLLHWLNSEFARAREEVCDNYVLQYNAAPRYARTLLFIAECAAPVPPPLPALGLLSLHWRLEDRVAGLLDPNRTYATRACRGVMSGAIILLLTAGIGIAGVQLVEAVGREPSAIVAENQADDSIRAKEMPVLLPRTVSHPLRALPAEREFPADLVLMEVESVADQVHGMVRRPETQNRT